jgi:hypothetical protein
MLVSAACGLARASLLAMPRQLAWRYPSMVLTTWNGCSTMVRICAVSSLSYSCTALAVPSSMDLSLPRFIAVNEPISGRSRPASRCASVV